MKQLKLLAALVLIGSSAAILAVRGLREESDAGGTVVLPTPTQELFVAPDGSSTAAGTREHPLDLKTALAAGSPAQPGAVVWLREGVYRGAFVSALNGTAEAPIIVRSHPGERAIIDSAPGTEDALWVNGSWTWFWGIEIMNSNPLRYTQQPGSFPNLRRGNGVSTHAPGSKFIHLIIHDMGNGLGAWSSAPDAEVYGNIIYNNGWGAPDRPHGHGIYLQNRDGAKYVRDNIIFNQFGAGIHAYGTGEANLDAIRLEGNVVFNNGALAAQPGANILVGGGVVANRPELRGNLTYHNPRQTTGANYVGYDAGCRDAIIEDNYLVGGYPLSLTKCGGRIANNVLLGIMNPADRSTYPDNSYYPDASRMTSRVFVQRSRYQPGRAQITVYNWARQRTVTLDLAAA
jgi:hypothetical protein